MNSAGRRLIGLCIVGALAVASSSHAEAADVPAQHENVLSVLPPGDVATVTAVGEAQGNASGDPKQYGAHTDDQRDLYWSFGFKSSNFAPRTGTPDTPAAGVQIYRDSYGVPAIYGDNGRDVWFGAGYVAAQDRLFLMDAVRRSGEGRLAELTGSGGVPDDVKQRVLNYTDAEYSSMFDRLSEPAKQALEGYTAGVNAYLAKINTDPTLLPAEYALLQAVPEKWTVKDSMASGVFMTRFVASEGGNEMAAVQRLQELHQSLGAAAGDGAFNDLYPLDDDKAVTTVQKQDGIFRDDSTPVSQRSAAFKKMSAWALGLLPKLASGPGTGGYTPPTDLGVPDVPGVNSGVAAEAAKQLDHWRDQLHGGSYAIALSGSRTTSGKAMLESAPQLGWTAPSYLYEIEVHGGGYDARGVTVPGLPVVGIGYTPNVAWALTTGYSKTIDSYIETTRSLSGKQQYLHNGVWLDESCRSETVKFRNTPQGVPLAPADRSVTVPVCRTVHGPIVASQDHEARSVQYAMWGHEVDTIEGVLAWNKAKSLKDFANGVAKVSWNENVTAADSAGNIGYWHPGKYPIRHTGLDPRFPIPGGGAYDTAAYRAFVDMPHVVNPKQGYIANWNTKPAVGWTAGETQSQDNGGGDHINEINYLIRKAGKIDLSTLMGIDRAIGSSDARSRVFLRPLIAALSKQRLTGASARGLAALTSWDGAAYAGDGTSAKVKDGVAATLFDQYMSALRAAVGVNLPADILASVSTTASKLHTYQVQRIDELALKVIAPASTQVKLSRDWTGDLGAIRWQQKAFATAVDLLVKQYGASPSTWHRDHPVTVLKTLTGVIGAPAYDLPYEDRGSWIQLVAFT